jgi:hypothetical protein
MGPAGQPMVQNGGSQLPQQGFAPQPGYPQAPQQPQQMGQVQLQPNMILDGPGVPTELRGRPVSQVFDVYNSLIQHYARTRTQPQPGFQAQPTQPGQAGGQPGAGQPAFTPAQPPQGQRNGYYGVMAGQPQQEDEDAIADRVAQRIMPMIQPIMQTALSNGLAAATQQAASVIPDYHELQAELITMMGQAQPHVAADVNSWITAADYIRGKRFRSQPQQPNGGQQPRPQPQVGLAQPYGLQQPAQPQGWAPAYQVPMGVPAGQQPHFFTEGPGAPMGSVQAGISPAERVIMQQFGMNEQQWVAHRDAATRRGY